MTKEQLKQILEALHLEYESKPTLIYVFYQTDEGLINNFSISVKRARQRNRQPMTPSQLAALMEREYPATRQGKILAVEHPDEGLTRWMDTKEVCDLLRTTPRSLRRWAQKGLLHPSHTGSRNYYDAADVEALLRSNIIQPNGRMDTTGTAKKKC